jgi:simple sugar transport system substrate-binding protein
MAVSVLSRFTVETLQENPFDYVLTGESLNLPLWYLEPLCAALTSYRQDGQVAESVKQYAKAEAANALADAGCDVITCHVDGPKVVVETAEARGVMTCGHNANQAPLAPKGFITGAEYKWETIYKIYADALAAETELPNFIAGGYHNDMLRNSAFGAGATPEGIKAAEAAIEGLKAGKPIYVGPLKDNKGAVVIDKSMDYYDPSLDGMNYLLEGVIGSIT